MPDSNLSARIRRRRVEAHELPFVLECLEESLRSHIERVWGWFPERNREQFESWIAAGQLDMIEFDSESAGVICVEARPEHLYIRSIFLRAAFRQRGIGAWLLAQTTREAENSGRVVVLKVIRGNPALGLYERLGFRQINEDPATLHMQYP